VKTLVSAEPILNNGYEMFVPHRNNCFELLGFDIFLDANCEPWLLEVNLSPSLNCDTPLDSKIKTSVIADLFTLAGIKF
jgi:tubulin polyglutamylase TTLL5